jgi:hypothetical protein
MNVAASAARARRVLISIATICGATLVFGCGSDDSDDAASATIDPAKIEPQLRDDLSRDAGVDPANVSLDCPSGEPATEGHRFKCTLTAPDGTTATVRVTVASAVVSDNEVDYHVEARVPGSQFK